MIIDIHTHIFPDKIADRTIDALSRAAHLNPHTNATAEQLTVSMQEAGIDISVNMPVATAARQVMKLNDSSVRQNEIYFENASVPRILSFGCMHPDYEDWHSELARMKELGLKGFKIHPVYQDTDIDDIRFLRIFERATPPPRSASPDVCPTRQTASYDCQLSIRNSTRCRAHTSKCRTDVPGNAHTA